MAQFLGNKTFSRKFGFLLVVCTGRIAIWTALVRFTIFGALVLAVRPWIAPFLLLACILQVRSALLLAEYSIICIQQASYQHLVRIHPASSPNFEGLTSWPSDIICLMLRCQKYHGTRAKLFWMLCCNHGYRAGLNTVYLGHLNNA